MEDWLKTMELKYPYRNAAASVQTELTISENPLLLAKVPEVDISILFRESKIPCVQLEVE